MSGYLVCTSSKQLVRLGSGAITEISNERVSDRRRREDRRRHDRLLLWAPVEIATGRDGALIHADTVDVSLGGCALSNPDGLAVGQDVTVVITAEGRIIWAAARVIHLACGRAGIEFVRVTPGPTRTLRSWLGEPGTRPAGPRRIR